MFISKVQDHHFLKANLKVDPFLSNGLQLSLNCVQ